MMRFKTARKCGMESTRVWSVRKLLITCIFADSHTEKGVNALSIQAPLSPKNNHPMTIYMYICKDLFYLELIWSEQKTSNSSATKTLSHNIQRTLRYYHG